MFRPANKASSSILCLIFLILAGFTSCKKESNISIQEPLKDITGSWEIVKLTRNGEDLTDRVDLSKFRLVFNKDSTYSLQGNMPFIVREPGTYSLDNPQYPFFIRFETQDKSIQDTLKLVYPVVNGVRQISVNISPGCSKNTYNYVFQKVQ
jgi:hypothetical protein